MLTGGQTEVLATQGNEGEQRPGESDRKVDKGETDW